jgi:hypothetical protein
MDKTKASPEPTDFRRVLLPLPSSTTSGEVLRAVTRLAGQLRADILGLLLKDEAVVRGAAVPFAREVKRLPATIVSCSSEDAERQFQAQVRWAEAILLKVAHETGTQGRLQVATGTAVDTVRSTSVEGDLIVIGESAHRTEGMDSLLESLIRGGTHPVLVIRPMHLLSPPSVAVVFEPTPEGERALRMAGQMAGRLGRTAVTLLAMNEERADETVDRARDLSETYGVGVSVRPLTALVLPRLARVLPTEDHSLLVVPGALLRPAVERMLRTLRALPGPFLVTP